MNASIKCLEYNRLFQNNQNDKADKDLNNITQPAKELISSLSIPDYNKGIEGPALNTSRTVPYDALITVEANINKTYSGLTCICEIESALWQDFFQDIAGTSWNIVDGEFVDLRQSSEYKALQAENRKAIFEKEFLETSLGCYRRYPKGYTAIESLNTVFNGVFAYGALPEELATQIKFYTKPDFSIESQCTEEWLVENSYPASAMTKERFMAFYTEFITKWNTEEHL